CFDHLHEDSEWEENQEVEFDLRPSEWLGSFDKNDLPNKLHNFVQPLLRGRKLGFGSFYRELMLEAFCLRSYHRQLSSMNLDHWSLGHYRMYRVDAILKTHDEGIPLKDH
ncbi:hypothetical protein Tco_0980559, partial [Tanacetum coccineum]